MESGSFADQLRRHRLRAGLSQEALATRAGLTPATISALERGVRRHPYPDTVDRLAHALALSASERAGLAAAARPAGAQLSGPPSLLPRYGGPGSVPAQTTTLIGRDGEIADLCGLLVRSPARLVTLTGVGGGGKTRLAQAVALGLNDAFPDGVCWVALAATVDADTVRQAVAGALGVVETPEVRLIDSLVARLATRAALLVLDNCEQVVDVCAELAERLLADCPNLRLLATSREPLLVAGEQQRRVPPLAVLQPDQPIAPETTQDSAAVQLFVERARAVAPGFRLTAQNAAAVVEVCTRLDGIPLALELAAARVRVLSAEQIRERLDDVFRLLTGGSRAGPTRQQTLRATLDWSHDLLSEPERALFRRLAVFSGSFDLTAAEAMAGPESNSGERALDSGPATLDLVTRLADRSLLLVEGDGPVARYRLLEPVRQYAQQHLAAYEEAAEMRRKHAAYYLALGEQAALQLRGPAQVAWIAQLGKEQDNLRAALRWAEEHGDTETLARLSVALTSFWEVSGTMSEGRRWLRAALAADTAPSLAGALHVRCLLAAGRLAFWQADIPDATSLFERSVALSRETGDRQAEAESLTWLGTALGRVREFAAGDRLLKDGLALHHALGDDHGAARALFSLGTAAGNQGDLATAVDLISESLELYRALGDVRLIANTSVMVGSALSLLGEFERARPVLREGLTGLREVGDRAFLLSGLLTLASIAAEAMRDALVVTYVPVNQRTHDSALRLIAAKLSEPELVAALAAGRAMSPEETIAQAMAIGTSAPAPAARPRPRVAEPLTRREREIVPLLARGATDREIAAALGIAVSTVGVHVHNILGKLDLRSRWQVAEWVAAQESAGAS